MEPALMSYEKQQDGWIAALPKCRKYPWHPSPALSYNMYLGVCNDSSDVNLNPIWWDIYGRTGPSLYVLSSS